MKHYCRYAMIHAAVRLERKVFRAICQVIKDSKRGEANLETVEQENARIRYASQKRFPLKVSKPVCSDS